jgi:hypothetical protein
MKHLPKLLGALMLTLALLASVGLASTNAHAAPAPAPQASTTPPLAPDQASVTLANGYAIIFHWGDEDRFFPPFPPVTQICTGSDTIVLFDSDQTGQHLIPPDTCESFQNEFGFVRVRLGFPRG